MPNVVKMASEGFVEGKLAGKADKSTTYTKTATDELLAGKQDIISDLAAIRSGAAAGATAYQKPSGGIPKTDLSSAVQTSLGKADTALQTHQDITGKADKVANATAGNLASLDANGNLADSGKDPADFVQIGETNTQPWEFDPMFGPSISPLFSVEAGYDNGGEWIQDSLMTFGANVIQMTDIIGYTSLGPNSISVNDGGLSETSTMTGSSVETPILHAGAVWGIDGFGVGDLELNEYCSVHTPYDESTERYAYQATGTEIIRAGSDYEAGTLGPLLDVNFGDEYGTIGYTDSYTGFTASSTVQYIVSAANGWGDGYLMVNALTVQNSGTLSLQGGSVEFMVQGDPENPEDPGYSVNLDASDANRLRMLYEYGTWVYSEYDPSTGGMGDVSVYAFDIASLVDTYVNNGLLTSGVNYVQSGQSSLFSVMDDSGLETVFTGRAIEFGDNGSGSVYTVVSDSGVTTPSLTLYDGNTSAGLSPSELEQIKTDSVTAFFQGEKLVISNVITQQGA